ncbi:hypothetical protein R1flu_006929 [Riccia fluitans]|uniref:Uncharacterized protein n=1 Tax=Riccia fluitans TaxID=41844 RepID=A0ABD1YXE3_9MARC
MYGKAMDVVGSSMGSQPPQEMPYIVEANVDVDVSTTSSWARLDALDSMPGTDFTSDWNTQPGTYVDNCLLADEFMPTKPQTDEDEDGGSLSLSKQLGVNNIGGIDF